MIVNHCFKLCSTKLKSMTNLTENTSLGIIYEKKSPKGTVSLQKNAKQTRLKYRYRGEVYFLIIPIKLKNQSTLIEGVKKLIENDIFLGIHDNSQSSYKQRLRLDTVSPKGTKSSPISRLNSLDKQLEQFFTEANRDLEKGIYLYTLRMVKTWITKNKNLQSFDLPRLLGQMNYAAETFNTRKFVLNIFCEWMVKTKKIETNPFDFVSSKKKSLVKDPRRRRLTDEEVKRILEAVQLDKFCKRHNRGFSHSHYYPIFAFMVYTGVRPAEAIGLQVKKIDFIKQEILIDQALARTRSGTNFSSRILKSTKTGTARTLAFGNNPILKEILKEKCKGRKANDYVFEGPNSGSCDDRKMNDNVLKPVLKGLHISERILYCFRHSFASRCVIAGMDIKAVQSMTGHRDVNILLNIYAEMSEIRTSLPNLI
jgi:integrase